MSFKRLFSTLCIIAILPIVLLGGSVFAEDRALIVGVSSYKDKRITALNGVMNDVLEIKRAFRSAFDLKPEHITTLFDSKASKATILENLRVAAEQMKPNDRLFFYYSGHGTSGRDSTSGGVNRLIPHSSGALLPYDADTESPQKLYDSLVIGARDLRPLLAQIDRKGAEVIAFFDACYSGETIRASSIIDGFDQANIRYFRLPYSGNELLRSGFVSADPDLCGFQCGTKRKAPYPYKKVSYISASAESEIAIDISGNTLKRYPTRSGRPQGAFTDALLRVLHGEIPVDVNNDGSLSVREIHRGVSCFMKKKGYPHNPQLLPGNSPSTKEFLAGGITKHRKTNPIGNTERLAVEIKGEMRDQISPSLDQEVKVVGTGADIIVQTFETKALLRNKAGNLIGVIEAPTQNDLASLVSDSVDSLVWVNSLKSLECASTAPWAYINIGEDGWGPNFRIGESVSLTFGTDNPAQLLLFSLNVAGQVNVLYPKNESELRLVQPGELIRFPSDDEKIEITPPAGMEILVLAAFQDSPSNLRTLAGKSFDIHAPEMRGLYSMIDTQRSKAGFSVKELLTVEN